MIDHVEDVDDHCVLARREVLLPVRPNALEIFLMALCVLVGGAGLVRIAGGTYTSHPLWLDIAWDVLTLTGGVAVIVGNYWPDKLTGMLVTRAGLAPISAGALMYAIGLASERQWLSATMVAGLCAATLWRGTQIGRQLKRDMIAK